MLHESGRPSKTWVIAHFGFAVLPRRLIERARAVIVEAQTDWRIVGNTINGYELWGSFDACAGVSRNVGETLRLGKPLADLSLDELRTFLFISSRAERHGGEPWTETVGQDRVLDEIVRRQGPEWILAEVERSRVRK